MSLYHVHVPRTSGTFIKRSICNSFSYSSCFLGHKKILEREDFVNKQFISGHFATLPLEYCEKAFAVIRDPNELTFSWIKLMAKAKPDIPFEELLEMYLLPSQLNYACTNLISKYVTGVIDVVEYNKNYNPNLITVIDNCFFIKDYITDYEDVISFIENKKINIYIYGSKNMYKNIFFDYNIDSTSIDDSKVVNESSAEYNYLYHKYFDIISELNYLDIPVYEYFKNKQINH